LRPLIKEPSDLITFETFVVEMNNLNLKVDVTTRIVKRRDGSRVLSPPEDIKKFRDSF
jgi:hypothetical protein